MKSKNIDIVKLFTSLFLFSLAGGIFYNYQQLWIIDNGMSVKTVGTVLSLGALITVSTIFIFSNIVTEKRLQKFASLLLVIKAIILLVLYFLDKTGNNFLIKFLTILDYAVDTEIYTCMYPMITFISKSDKMYALRGLIYEIAYYFGVLVASFSLGKVFGKINIIYNSYLYVSVFLIIFSYFILNNIKLEKYIKSKKNNDNSEYFLKIINRIKKDKISQNYLLFSFFEQIAYYIVMGLFLTFLTEKYGFNPTVSSNLIFIVSVFSILLGIIILYKGSFKNNYINLSIKYFGRFLISLFAFIIGGKHFFLVSLIFIKVFNSSYTHISDAPYINRFDDEEQFAFCNLCEMVNYFGRAIGTYLCGLLFINSYRTNFGFAAFFALIELYFMYKSLYLLNKEKLNDRK